MDSEIYSEQSHTRNERAVLVIAHDFPPYGMQSVLRPLKFVRHLHGFQWRTVVLAATSPPAAFTDEHLADELSGYPVQVYRTSSAIEHVRTVQGKNDPVMYLAGSTGRRLQSMVSQTFHQPERNKEWMKEALAIAREIIRVEKVEIILATAPPFSSLLLAQRLSHEFDIPFVIDYRDAWLEGSERFCPTPLHRSANARLETELLKLAEKIIVVSRHTKELLLRNYGFLEHNDVRIIPHGYDDQDFAPYADTRPTRDVCTITSTVNFTGRQTPQFFLKALKKFLTATPDAQGRVEVRFAGLLTKRSVKLIKKLRLEDTVRYFGALPHTEKIRHIVESHATWLVHRDNYSLPEELYDYIGARKPIIAAVPSGTLATTVQDTMAGMITRPGNVNDMAQALGTLYSQWRSGALPAPKEQVAEHFNYNALTADLSRELGLATKLV